MKNFQKMKYIFYFYLKLHIKRFKNELKFIFLSQKLNKNL